MKATRRHAVWNDAAGEDEDDDDDDDEHKDDDDHRATEHVPATTGECSLRSRRRARVSLQNSPRPTHSSARLGLGCCAVLCRRA